MSPRARGDRFAPRDPDYAARVRASFKRQTAMDTLGMRLESVAPGAVSIGFAMAPALSQQQGFLHGGVLTAALDSACGYAALSLSPAGWDVLTVEFKVNFLAPARADRFLCVGRVVKAGKTITVCEGEALAVAEDAPAPIATMTATLFMLAAEGAGNDQKAPAQAGSN